VNALGIFLAYFIVISGWLGYHKSIKKHSHKGILGVVRYEIDLVILFLVYYLVSIDNPKANDQYGMIFIWVIPTMFLFYMLWDLVKFQEWKSDRDNVPAHRLRFSAIYGIISMDLSLAYYFLNMAYGVYLLEFWQNKTSLDFIFICASFFLFLLYRIDKSIGLFPFKLKPCGYMNIMSNSKFGDLINVLLTRVACFLVRRHTIGDKDLREFRQNPTKPYPTRCKTCNYPVSVQLHPLDSSYFILVES
jgi:hypothetical protein